MPEITENDIERFNDSIERGAASTTASSSSERRASTMP